MKNIRIGLKLTLGFGLVILLMSILGETAIYQMHRIQDSAVLISESYMPQLNSATLVERNVNSALLTGTLYTFTEDQRMLDASEKSLAVVAQEVEDVLAFAGTRPELAALAKTAQIAQSLVKEYSSQLQQSKVLLGEMSAIRAALSKNINQLIAALETFSNKVKAELDSQVDFPDTPEDLQAHIDTLAMVSAATTIAQDARYVVIEAQVQRNREVAQQATEQLKNMEVALQKMASNYREIQHGEGKDLDTMLALVDVYLKDYQKMLVLWDNLEKLTIARSNTGSNILADARNIINEGLENASSESVISATKAGSSALVMKIGLILCFFVALFIAILLSRMITRPINQGVRFAESLAAGNLEEHLDIHQSDEVGKLAAALNIMVDTLKRRIKVAQDATEQASIKEKEAMEAAQSANAARAQAENARREGMLAAASQLQGVVQNVGTAIQSLSTMMAYTEKASHQQASRMAETATAMDEMTATVSQVAQNANGSAEVSSSAKEKANDGAQIVQQVVAGMNEVSRHTKGLKSDMENLGGRVENIGAIMNVISDIADQTNLLALNAAIEAARAGEAGRGFAVVADEVRKLAEKTMQATGQVGDAIRGIQDGTRKNAETMDKTSETVSSVTEMANRSGQALHEIVGLCEHAADQVSAIATASEQQSTTSAEINRAIEQVSSSSIESAQNLQQAMRSIDDLSKQSKTLSDLIISMQNS